MCFNGFMENKLSKHPSTQEIDQTVEQLQVAYSHNFLNELEFDEKMNRALLAKDREELEEILQGLTTNEPEKSTFAIMSGLDKNGHFVVGKSYQIKAIMGGCSIDFRQAQFKYQETTMNVVAIMGGVEMIFPKGIRIIVEGMPILGGISQSPNKALPPYAPQIKIKAKAILGGIDISIKTF